MAEENSGDNTKKNVEPTADSEVNNDEVNNAEEAEVNAAGDSEESSSKDNAKELTVGEKLLQKAIAGESVPNSILLENFESTQLKNDLPNFRAGDTIKVHAKIVEGTKERIQVFEGVVLKRAGRNTHSATFTVRKISNNIGVERTFLLHSPSIDKIELVTQGVVRRARLFYLRERSGKSARIKSLYDSKKKARTVATN